MQKKKQITLEGRAPAICGGLSSSTVPNSTFNAYTYHLHDALLAQAK